MLKLGRELKELETVQDELEKKEQELRAERNTVTIQDFFLIFNREQTSGSKLTLDGTFFKGQEVEAGYTNSLFYSISTACSRTF